MMTATILQSYAEGMERLTTAAPGGRVYRSGPVAFNDSGTDNPAFNAVLVLGDAWTAPAVEAVAGAAAETGRDWSMLVQAGSGTIHDRARMDATERVATANGLIDREEVPVLACSPNELKTASKEAAAGVRAIGADEWECYTATVASGFSVPAAAFGQAFAGGVLDDPAVTGYLSIEDGVPIATGLGLLAAGAVGVFNIAVAPGHRRRGVGRAVTVRAAADGFTRGATVAWLLSTAEGRPLYESLGFRQVDSVVQFVAPSA